MILNPQNGFNADIKFFRLRTLGSLGYTTGGNVNVGEGSLLNYRFGLQSIFQISKYTGFGLDLGYLRAFTTNYTNLSDTKARSNYSKSTFFHSLVVFDFTPGDQLFIIQFGVGPYFGTGDNKDVSMGIMITTGIDFPINSFMSLPIIMRYEFIISEHTLIPINFYSGITFRFG